MAVMNAFKLNSDDDDVLALVGSWPYKFPQFRGWKQKFKAAIKKVGGWVSMGQFGDHILSTKKVGTNHIFWAWNATGYEI